MSYSNSCWSIGKEVVNRSTRASVALVKRPPQALADLAVDREKDTFLEARFFLEEKDLFFSRVFFGALIVIERLSSCLAVVGGLAWFCLWLTEEP